MSENEHTETAATHLGNGHIDVAIFHAQMAIAISLHRIADSQDRIADVMESVIGGDQYVKVGQYHGQPVNLEEE